MPLYSNWLCTSHRILNTIQASSKIKSHKACGFLFLNFIWTFCLTERSRGRSTKKKTTPFEDDLIPKHKRKHFYKKRKKRNQRFVPGIQKSKFKPSVPDKISTLTFPVGLFTNPLSLIPHRGSILSRKLAFLKPSTRQDGFLFFPFFFCKNVCEMEWSGIHELL